MHIIIVSPPPRDKSKNQKGECVNSLLAYGVWMTATPDMNRFWLMELSWTLRQPFF